MRLPPALPILTLPAEVPLWSAEIGAASGIGPADKVSRLPSRLPSRSRPDGSLSAPTAGECSLFVRGTPAGAERTNACLSAVGFGVEWLGRFAVDGWLRCWSRDCPAIGRGDESVFSLVIGKSSVRFAKGSSTTRRCFGSAELSFNERTGRSSPAGRLLSVIGRRVAEAGIAPSGGTGARAVWSRVEGPSVAAGGLPTSERSGRSLVASLAAGPINQ